MHRFDFGYNLHEYVMVWYVHTYNTISCDHNIILLLHSRILHATWIKIEQLSACRIVGYECFLYGFVITQQYRPSCADTMWWNWLPKSIIAIAAEVFTSRFGKLGSEHFNYCPIKSIDLWKIITHVKEEDRDPKQELLISSQEERCHLPITTMSATRKRR